MYRDTLNYKKYLKSEFGDKQPGELIRLDVDRFRINLCKKYAAQTVTHILNLLTWIINFGAKNGFCEPLRFKIQRPKINNIKTEDLSPEQLRKLLKVLNEDSNRQVAHLMKMALFTGMRRGELFKLKWEDIDFQRGFIHIRGPKGGKNATIPMSEQVIDLLSSKE